MEPAVWIAMIGAAVTVTATTITPILINRQRAKNDLNTKRIDWERQDEVAARVIEAAEAAKVAAVRQADRADRAEELLAKNTKVVSEKTEQLTEKVEMVHILVNSNLTAERAGQLRAKRRSLELLEELIAVKQENNRPVRPTEITEVETLKLEIEDLMIVLADRERQAKLAEQEADKE